MSRRFLPLCRAGVVSLAIGSLSACGGPGPVTLTGVPTPPAQERQACAALIAALPESLGNGLSRRDVRPPVATAAAFGSEPAVLTCGVAGTAADYQPTAVLTEIDGVGWFPEALGEQIRYSTPTRTPQVVLTLPAKWQVFEIFVAVAPAIRAHTRPTTA